MAISNHRSLICFLLFGVAYGIHYFSHDWSEQLFNHAKKYGSHSANLVFIGDSRTLQGIDPVSVCDAMEGQFVGYNQGFSGGCFSPEMFDLAERRHLTSDENSLRVVFLGVTPHSLCISADREYDTIESCDAFIPTPTPPSHVVTYLFNLSVPKMEIEYCVESGWKKVYHEERVMTYSHGSRDSVFLGDKKRVRSEVVAELLEQVRQLRSRGIHVFVCRPPTCPETEAMENQSLGFDEKDFVKKIEEAGGVWLDLRADDYCCYDGSHLEPDSAVKLSKRLGDTISRHLRSPKFNDVQVDSPD